MKSHRNVIQHSLLVLAALALVGSLCKKPPHVPEKPTGPSIVQLGSLAAFSTKTTDPSGSTVRYEFDWNDGTTSGWGPYVAQSIAYPDTHTFEHSGSFAVKARAQNVTNATSGWSDTLRVAVLSGETTLKWIYAYLDESFDSVVFSGTVAESPDGYLYAVSEGGFLHIVTQDGGRRAAYQTIEGDEFTTSPMICSGGLAWDAAGDTTLYAIRVNGTRAYGIPTRDDIISALACDGNGRVYFNCENESLYCVDSAGRRWAAWTGGGPSSPVISADGAMVVCGGNGGMIQGFSTDSGVMLWQWTTGGSVNSTGAIGSDGAIYIGSDDGSLYAMKQDGGAPQWQYAANSPIPTSPVIDGNGIIYFAAEDGVVHAVNSATHSVVWTHSLNSQEASTGALTQAGVLLLKALYTDSDSLIALNTSDGSQRWSAGLPSGSELDIVCSPLIDQGGIIYVTTNNGLYAYWGSSGPAASAWPMFQHDMERTGKATAK
jgi:outer membrane protein assembly factor BamB